ncbi:MAG: hypothetical protein RQ741_07235 [Wenzhouxiangellaceae bacterium]|nr:hypothetical protein [Wenzhouxiangellaceae bacterium]
MSHALGLERPERNPPSFEPNSALARMATLPDAASIDAPFDVPEHNFATRRQGRASEGQVNGGALVHKVEPKFPAPALRNATAGFVEISFGVNTGGQVVRC